MEKLVDSYLDNSVSEENLKLWLQGISAGSDELSSKGLPSHTELSVNTFAEHFFDNLHQAFDWLLKQSSHVPHNRVTATKKIPHNSITNENKVQLNINDRESFPSLGEADKSQNKPNKILTKRIKPTLVSQTRAPLNDNSTFQNISFGNSKTQNSDNLQDVRDLLKNFKTLNTIPKFSADASKNKADFTKFCIIEPKYELISHKEEIIKLKTLYVNLLLNNHFTSLTEEIRFILEIINKRTVIDCAPKLDALPTKMTQIFASYHNGFYFVHLAFEAIFIDALFINLLDCKAIDSILANFIDYRVDDASQNIKELITRTYVSRLPEATHRSASGNNFVYFQPDTDSKSNFPNDHSFSTFRRQRDEFYRVFKTYHDIGWLTCMSTDRKVQNLFVSNIRSMLSMSKDVGNFYHLARLFVSQLLRTCHDTSDQTKKAASTPHQKNTPTNPGSRTLSEKDKLKRLEDRFVKTSHSANNLSSNFLDESFTQKERFFRDFILHCDSHSFNVQLEFILKSHIIDLTTSDLYNFVENSFDDEGDDSLLVHLARLNLLAKFLGFLYFYPLDTSLNNEKISEKDEFVRQQTSLRALSSSEGVGRVLDIETYLVNAMEHHILVMAVPWVVEFLLFIDQITLTKSPYYENVLSLLCLIYKFYLPSLSQLTEEYSSQVSLTRLVIQQFLEKLFAIKKFNAAGRLKALLETITDPTDVRSKMFHKVKNATSLANINEVYLDFHNDIFDFELISTFFPQFSRLIVEQFKQLSSEGRRITTTRVTSKHPLHSPNDVFTSLNTNTKSLIQTQAEECFLNIHSHSLKKCIHFLNDRISATCIKRIKCEVYPKTKETHFTDFVKSNDDFVKEMSISETAKGSSAECIVKLAEAIRSNCKHFVPDYSSKKIKIIFPLIIVDDLDESVIAFAIKICLRHIEQRCNSWIDLNITNETINTDLTAFTRRQGNLAEASKGAPMDSPLHDVASIYTNFEKLVYELREMLLNVNVKHFEKVEISHMITLLVRVESLRTLPFLPSSNARLFDQITLDLAISLVACNPQLMTDELLDSFLHLWTSQKVTYNRVLCAKTLYQLSQSTSTISSWLKLEFLMTRMLKGGVIDFDDIEQDALTVLKQNWCPKFLTKLASVLKSLVECAKKANLLTVDDEGNSSDRVLDWLSAWLPEEADGLTFE